MHTVAAAGVQFILQARKPPPTYTQVLLWKLIWKLKSVGVIFLLLSLWLGLVFPYRA